MLRWDAIYVSGWQSYLTRPGACFKLHFSSLDSAWQGASHVTLCALWCALMRCREEVQWNATVACRPTFLLSSLDSVGQGASLSFFSCPTHLTKVHVFLSLFARTLHYICLHCKCLHYARIHYTCLYYTYIVPADILHYNLLHFVCLRLYTRTFTL